MKAKRVSLESGLLIWSFDLIGNYFRAARFPSETKSGLFLVMLAFCDFSFGPDSMLVLFRDAPPRCEPFLRQICLLFYSCSQSQRDFLFGGLSAHFAVGHQDTRILIGLTLVFSIVGCCSFSSVPYAIHIVV